MNRYPTVVNPYKRLSFFNAKIGYEIKKCILLSERNQSTKAKNGKIPIIGYSKKGKSMETIKGLVVAKS